MKNKFNDDDDEDSIPELSSLDDILDFGLRPGSSSSKKAGANGFKTGTLEEMMEQDDAELEAEIMNAMREFEEDPAAATRKQLVRMATIEWRHLQKLYKEFSKVGNKQQDRSKTLRYDIDSSTSNLLKLQTSLKALPVQRKEEVVNDNVAALSVLVEQYKKENPATDDIKILLNAQIERIRKEETGT